MTAPKKSAVAARIPVTYKNSLRTLPCHAHRDFLREAVRSGHSRGCSREARARDKYCPRSEPRDCQVNAPEWAHPAARLAVRISARVAPEQTCKAKDKAGAPGPIAGQRRC